MIKEVVGFRLSWQLWGHNFFFVSAFCNLQSEPFQSLDIKLWTDDPGEALFLGNPKKTMVLRLINIPRDARNIMGPGILSYEAELVSVLMSS